MKRKPLSKSEIKELNTKLESFSYSYHKKDPIVLVDDMYIVNSKDCEFFYRESVLIPTLKFLLRNESIKVKEVVVDMGAVKFIVNGSDVMRPGITDIDDTIEKNDIVVVYDENNHKPLIIGLALLNALDMQEQTSGKSITNIHYIGDELWQKEF